MKKTSIVKMLSLSGAIIMLYSSCKKEGSLSKIASVSTANKVLVLDFTATWCHVCGEQGHDKNEEIKAKYPDNVIIMGVHSANSFSQAANSVATELTTKYSVPSTPSYAAVNKGIALNPYSYNGIEDDIEDWFTANAAAAVGVGIAKEVKDGKLEINTKTIFFKEHTGTYNLALYVVEDGVQYNQTRDRAPNPFLTTHNNILRGSANGTWGEKIVADKASKNQEIDGSYSYTIPSTVKNPDNLHVIAVVYKMENNQA